MTQQPLSTPQKHRTVLDNIPEHVRLMQPYRPGKPLEEMGLARVIKLASNENPLGMSPKALSALQANLTQNHIYPDPVSRQLRQKIAASYGILPEEIAVAAGSENILATIIRALIEPGDKAVQGYGAFMGFAIHFAAHGGILQQVPSPNYQFDIDAMIDAVTPDTKILYLPNPNNPTGTYITQSQLQRLLHSVAPSTLVVLDEAYIEYCNTLPDYPDALSIRQDNVIILRTFSKAYGLAALRIGYAIGHPALIEQIMKVKMTFEPTRLAQVAAEAAWEDTNFIAQTVQNNATERIRVTQALQQMGLTVVPSVTNFVMVPLQNEAQVNALNEVLLAQGIALRPLASFGFPHCFRISIGLPEENAIALDAIQAAIPNLPLA